ncbi:MAG: hypothetical protein DI551_01370 [Micavibrio aeruginosavorus]|uniref:Methyltransferase domain-containing protein n=1 Tax=Micavibrio aeruginosavorus TaxID=349221 RepID=A0A2W5N5E7_9BACT|nr:MAG: hypothetical protein DI551_01370 [Micavibrio aeruginosavorus]
MNIFDNFSEQALSTAYHYDSWANSYDRDVSEEFSYEAHKKVAEAVREYACADAINILDLGTGTGLVLQELKPAFSKASMTGLDASIQMLDKQRSKYLGTRLQHCDIGSNDWPVPENHFDIVTCAGTLSLIPDLNHVLDQTRKAARTGATIAMSFLIGTEQRKDHFLAEIFDGTRIYQRTPSEMRQAVEKHGFKVHKTPDIFIGYAGQTFREYHGVIAFIKN